MPTVTPDSAASGLLDFLWKERDGTFRLPVDPIQIATSLGVEVVNAELKPDMAASLVKRRGSDAVILLNRADSRSRRRFSCAHELGHYVDHIRRGEEQFEYIEYRDPASTTGLSPDEVNANQFAAALLMPADWVRHHHEQGRRQLELATLFGVSGEAMGFRLDNLGLPR